MPEDLYAAGAYEEIYHNLEKMRDEALKSRPSEYGPVVVHLNVKGSPRPVEISFHAFSNKLVIPPSLYMIGIARDTEARHQGLLALLDKMGIAYFRADIAGKTIESTPAEERITGYSAAEFDEFSRDRLYEDSRDREELLRKLRNNGGLLISEPLRGRRKDGSLFWVEGDFQLIRDAEGREILEGFYKDITHRIQLQSFVDVNTGSVLQEEELFTRLKANAEFHLDYVNSLSHQLQTPLSSLVENLRNIKEGVLSQRDIADRLSYVVGQAGVCARLVRNLSYMDKILRGESFQRGEVGLARLAIQTKLDFLHLIQERKLDVEIEGGSLDRYLRVLGHQEMLRQVLVNLLDNAIKYSVPGSKILIRGLQWRQGPVLEISNQGLSIPREFRERIFERGFRTAQAKANVPHGTGLGLWLVRRILEAHGASIHCDELLEHGAKRTVFRIFFHHQNQSSALRRSA